MRLVEQDTTLQSLHLLYLLIELIQIGLRGELDGLGGDLGHRQPIQLVVPLLQVGADLIEVHAIALLVVGHVVRAPDLLVVRVVRVRVGRGGDCGGEQQLVATTVFAAATVDVVRIVASDMMSGAVAVAAVCGIAIVEIAGVEHVLLVDALVGVAVAGDGLVQRLQEVAWCGRLVVNVVVIELHIVLQIGHVRLQLNLVAVIETAGGALGVLLALALIALYLQNELLAQAVNFALEVGAQRVDLTAHTPKVAVDEVTRVGLVALVVVHELLEVEQRLVRDLVVLAEVELLQLRLDQTLGEHVRRECVVDGRVTLLAVVAREELLLLHRLLDVLGADGVAARQNDRVLEQRLAVRAPYQTLNRLHFCVCSSFSFSLTLDMRAVLFLA